MVNLRKSKVHYVGTYTVEMFLFEPNEPTDADIQIELRQLDDDTFMTEYFINKNGLEISGIIPAKEDKAVALLHTEHMILKKLKKMK